MKNKDIYRQLEVRPQRRLQFRGIAVAMAGLALVSWMGQGWAQGWAQGRPPELENSPLAPHAGRLTVTPPDQIPVDRIQLPPGFKVEIWAHGMPGARMMTRGDKGTIFVGTRQIGRVYAVSDNGNTRTHRIITEGHTQPNGVAFRNGSLYVAAINKVMRFDGVEDKLDSVPAPKDLTKDFGLPSDGHHGWKFLAFGPDGKLYVPVGAPCNRCEVHPDVHANIRRYNPDGTGMEIVARGVRNSVGFDFHPNTGELWFTDNDADWLSEHGPQCELNRVSQPGENFGFPRCHGHGIIDPEFGTSGSCDGVTLPAALMGGHTAPLGMRFYTGNMFPEEYRGSMFIARRGSWNRTVNVGFDVVLGQLSADGKRAAISPFMTGFLDTAQNTFWGRPVDVLVMPDGALLVSDDHNGAIYRITYEG
ncbi:MAG: PQQ-dependent sugar dehydrogenase [Gammaproteobacteria bacterium]|nr:PQQ-dependent sugar dehydrogenase [Gammaproteobacteria bacterium]